MRNFGYFEKDQIGSISDLRLWRRILRYSLPFSLWLTAAVVLSLVIAGTTLILPKLMQLGIDTYIIPDTLPLQERLGGLKNIAIVFGATMLILFLTGFFQVIILEYTGQSVMQQIRVDLFANMLHLDLHFFTRQPAGRLVTRLTNDITNMHEMFTSVMVTLFNDFLKITGILIILFSIHLRLAFVMSVFLPLSIGIIVIFSRMARKRFRAIRTQLAKLNSFLLESVSGVDIIQSFNRENDYRKSFSSLSSEYMKQTFSQIKLFGTFMPLVEFMSLAAVSLILLYGGTLVIDGSLTLGELVAFLAYMRLFFRPVRELSQKYSIVQSALASAERIFLLLDTKSSIQPTKNPFQQKKIAGSIQFQNVWFAYSPGEDILSDINLNILQGESIAIVGATGSGKSTLINLLLGFYKPDRGKITLDGIDIDKYNSNLLLNAISIIMQDTIIIPGTILDNITLESGKTREQVQEILHQTAIDAFIRKLPEGLDTLLRDGGSSLSAGERQLLSIARALCRDTPIFILDEATAFVDTETEAILGHALQNIFQKKTSLIIAHRLSTVQQADRIIVLGKGRILEQGTHMELMDKKENYFHLVSIDQHFSLKE